MFCTLFWNSQLHLKNRSWVKNEGEVLIKCRYPLCQWNCRNFTIFNCILFDLLPFLIVYCLTRLLISVHGGLIQFKLLSTIDNRMDTGWSCRFAENVCDILYPRPLCHLVIQFSKCYPSLYHYVLPCSSPPILLCPPPSDKKMSAVPWHCVFRSTDDFISIEVL